MFEEKKITLIIYWSRNILCGIQTNAYQLSHESYRKTSCTQEAKGKTNNHLTLKILEDKSSQ